MSDTRPGPRIIPVKPHTTLRERSSGLGAKLRVGWASVRVYVAQKKSGRLLLLQCAGALSVLVGISFYSIPAALIVGGLGAILAAERQ